MYIINMYTVIRIKGVKWRNMHKYIFLWTKYLGMICNALFTKYQNGKFWNTVENSILSRDWWFASFHPKYHYIISDAFPPLYVSFIDEHRIIRTGHFLTYILINRDLFYLLLLSVLSSYKVSQLKPTRCL